MTPYRDREPPKPFDKFPILRMMLIFLWLVVLGYTTVIGVLRGLIDGVWWGLYLPLHWLATIPFFVFFLWLVKKKRWLQ